MDINQNLSSLMKEAQKMQQKMQQAQEDLTKLEVTGQSGGGLVKVIMNGRHDAKSVKINATLLEEDVEMIEDLVAAAINDASQKIEAKSKEKIGQLTAGLNIPTDLTGKEGNE